ncbi:MAG: response regulator [Salibacteraceae bacterium]
MKEHVIIIDDDPIVILIMEKLLKNTGFHPKPISFESGVSALKHLKSIYNNDQHFVIFLDINMPEMNGWQFLEKLASFANLSNTDVAIITSSTDGFDKQQADTFPLVKEYFTKPILKGDITQLQSRFNQ